MAVRTRSELRRIDQAQTVHDKRSFGIAIFTIVVLFFGLVTFMNPIFMKSQIAKESNGVVAERYINQKFDKFYRISLRQLVLIEVVIIALTIFLPLNKQDQLQMR